MRIDWHKFIGVDPEVHHGEPCIKGTRVPVSVIVGSVADGMTFDEIINSYPQLEKESVQAALAYAADILHERNDDGWDQLMEIRKKLGKGRKNNKNSVEILSEMRR